MKQETFKKLKLPDKPGVYFFLKKTPPRPTGTPPRKGGEEILYIGKATSLRDRVKSYFGKDLIETRGPLLVDMVFKADKIKYEVADSVLEALILEANLIKKYQPYYNTKEKDDKSFNYVCITKLHIRHGVYELPKVIVVRGKELGLFLNKQKYTRRHSHLVLEGQGLSGRSKDSSEHISVYFGPYTSGSQLREALKIIRRIFPFLDDKSKNYLEFYKQINLVPDLKDRKLYMQNIKNIILFFEGKKKKVLKNLEKEMKEYAKNCEFEKAGEVKRQIFALKHINDVALLKNGGQNAFERSSAQRDGASKAIFQQENMRGEPESILPGVFRIEAYDIAHMGGKNMVGVMVVVENSEVEKSEYKRFKIRTQNNANDIGALKEVLERRLAHTEWTYPNLIVVDGGVAQINVTKEVLKKLNINIPIVSVLKDERHKPKAILGDKEFGFKYKREILLTNSEAHRFAINYHKNMRDRNFLR